MSYLHNEGKKYFKKPLIEKIEVLSKNEDTDKKEVDRYKKLIEILNVSHFYNLALYYSFKDQFDDSKELRLFKKATFDYSKFYDKTQRYRNDLISAFTKIFVQKTIQILRDKAGGLNVNNWVKSSKNEEIFLETLKNDLSLDIDHSEKYIDFVKKYKISLLSHR